MQALRKRATSFGRRSPSPRRAADAATAPGEAAAPAAAAALPAAPPSVAAASSQNGELFERHHAPGRRLFGRGPKADALGNAAGAAVSPPVAAAAARPRTARIPPFLDSRPDC